MIKNKIRYKVFLQVAGYKETMYTRLQSNVINQMPLLLQQNYWLSFIKHIFIASKAIHTKTFLRGQNSRNTWEKVFKNGQSKIF